MLDRFFTDLVLIGIAIVTSSDSPSSSRPFVVARLRSGRYSPINKILHDVVAAVRGGVH